MRAVAHGRLAGVHALSHLCGLSGLSLDGLIQRSEGREILNLRGDPLLLRSLSDEFDLGVSRDSEKQFAVIVGVGEQRIGLLVDRLDGQQDTVIKPIQGPVKNVRGFAGATELGDQDAVLVVDISSLVDDTLSRKESA